MFRTKWLGLSVAGAMALVGVIGTAEAQQLDTVRVASGLSRPVFATAPPGDMQRLFIVEQSGRIRILDLSTNTVLGTAFLDISTQIGGGTSGGDERGLLGLAFHPNYANNGYFFIYFYSSGGQTILRRYQANAPFATSTTANTATSTNIMATSQPFTNHNGGWIGFGPDGYLYSALGDGGSANDPNGNAQNLNTRLGKMLRIDIDSASPYAIPPTNPFAVSGGLPEIWAYGLRNPYRASFDRGTGAIYIGDVGQGAREEISYQPPNTAGPGNPGYQGGRNYGWRCMEGINCTGLTGCTCNSPALNGPIHDYPWGSAPNGGRAVIGGHVYRGSVMPSFQGTYFFADYASSQYWTFVYNGASVTNHTNRTADLAPPVGSLASPTSISEDAAGELYITTLGGEVHKIIPSAPVNDTCINASSHFGGSVAFSNISAGTDGPAEPGQCDTGGYTQIGSDVWFKHTAQCTGILRVSLCGANFNTKLAVYTSCPVSSGELIACSDDYCGTASEVAFQATAGTVYRIRIGGHNAATGTGNVVITCTVPTPCDADITGDFTVNVNDLLAVINGWGPCGKTCPADVAPPGGDQVVNVNDLLAVINAWGPCP